jgi:hypothetical protein
MCCINWPRYITQIKLKINKKIMKNKPIIEKMKKDYGMTVHELSYMIKLKGLVIPTEIGVDSLLGGTYVERAIILFEGKYFLTLIVLDKQLELCYYDELYVFDTHKEAQDFYKKLIIKLNSTII